MQIWEKWNWRTEIIWASTREDLSSGFPTMQDSNQPAQLQRVARELKFRVLQVYQLYLQEGEQQWHWLDCADV